MIVGCNVHLYSVPFCFDICGDTTISGQFQNVIVKRITEIITKYI